MLVKRQDRSFMALEGLSDIASNPERKRGSRSTTDEEKIKKIVSAKFAENNVKGAVSVISGS